MFQGWSDIFHRCNSERAAHEAGFAFQLYVMGYASLFNHDDEACDEWSFTFWSGKGQKLTTQLRHDINAVVDEGKELYEY